jgi:radical SAM superfamily enzyme YgiQ (UPF0313 family)
MLTSENRNGPVVLISCDIAYTFPLSYPYLASYLVEQGEDVRMFFKQHSNWHSIVQQVMLLDPLLVGFGSLFTELGENSEIIGMFNKAGRKFPIVIGGQMVSPIPRFAVEITGADFGVIGEGEIILAQIVKTLREGGNILDVKGLMVRNGNEYINTGVGEYIEDLTKLPPIQYELFPSEKWLPIGKWYKGSQWHWHDEDRCINVHGGRGCPFNCNFCYHHSKARYRPVGIMMKEATNALRRFDGNMLYFSDDTALITPSRTREIVDGIRGLYRKVDYHVSSRIDILSKMDDDLLRDMKDSGCRCVGIGIESGSPRILKIIGKPYTPEMVLDVIRRLSSVGIFSTVSVMVGQLTETREDAQATFNLVRETIRIDPKIQYAVTYTMPYPGSSLYSDVFKLGLASSHRDFYDKYQQGLPYPFQLSTMSKKEVKEMVLMIENVFEQERQSRSNV